MEFLEREIESESWRMLTDGDEQRLLVPRRIELSCSEEATVLEHMATYNANGFHFAVDLSAAPGSRHSNHLSKMASPAARYYCAPKAAGVSASHRPIQLPHR